MTFLIATQVAFYYMAVASISSAILAVTRKNPVHSMLWVLALFLHVAGIFLLLNAAFLAAVQVIVYSGAILIFYLFVLMLLDLPEEEFRPRFGKHWPFAVAGGIGFAALSWLSQFETLESAETKLASASVTQAAEDSPLGSVAGVGMEIFGPFALPFEIASLVLLAAIVGAVILARRRAES